jgi:RNA polymerase sigma-70 factor (ECF subfamily)
MRPALEPAALAAETSTSLRADHREVMNLVYYQNKSIEEVAKIVGVPTNTVKTRMFYARRQLAELFRETDADCV